MRWPWRRAAPSSAPAPPPSAPEFDVSLDLDPGPHDPAAAAQAVRAGVGALPGAGWISVEPHRGAGLTPRLFPPGSAVEAQGDGWDRLRRLVVTAAEAALAALPAREAGWSLPEPEATGFAEALAPSQFDALEQLAAIASLARKPKEAEPPAEAEGAGEVSQLASLLRFVLPEGVDGTETAAAAIRRLGSFAAVLAAPEAELRRVPGLGTHSVAAIKLVHAAAIRFARAGVAGRPVLDDRERLHDYLAAALARERIEQFRILFLDERGMLQADEVQARGTVNHTPVYPREVVRRALSLGAASLLLVHNHPSGDPAPSREDIEMTRQVQQAAAVMGIGLRDHVIVGNGRWLSFRDEGLLG